MTDTADRRAFLERVSLGAAALVAGAVPTAVAVADAGHKRDRARAPWNESWLDRLTGKHKQFFDAVSAGDGGMGYASGFLDLYHEAYGLSDQDLTAVIGLRHFAAPVGLSDEIWAKYKLGEKFNVTDPATKAIAVRNPFLHSDGMRFPGTDLPSMVKRGVIVTVCNEAVTHISALQAPVAGVTPDAAKQEWQASLIPGATLVPIGVIAVNRAQEKGCTYCYAA
jgi:intracellular sulfur oxidation DsrE/DsrF family protein